MAEVKDEEKNKWVAVGINCLLPGVGQVYLGQTNKGIKYFVVFLISAALTPVVIGFPFLVGIWIYSMYKAYMIDATPKEK